MYSNKYHMHTRAYTFSYTHIREATRGEEDQKRSDSTPVKSVFSSLLLHLLKHLPLLPLTVSACSLKILLRYQLISLKRNEHNIVSSQKKGRKKEKEDRRKRGKKEGMSEGKEEDCALYKGSLIVAILRLAEVSIRAMLVPQIPMTVSVLTSHL